MNILGWLCICLPSLFLGVDVWLKYPSNHGSGLVVYVALGVFALIVNLLYIIISKRLALLRIVALAAFPLLLYACDRFNVHITYEKWIERGMPEWGCREGVRSP